MAATAKLKKPTMLNTPVLDPPTVEFIGPKEAMEYLKHNAKNRELRDRRVSEYVSDLHTGKWFMTHQGIALDPDGNLVDGQHRLHAIIIANVIVPMFVTRGLTLAAAAGIDGNLPRTIPDKLRIHEGLLGTTRIKARATVVLWAEDPAFTYAKGTTYNQILDCYRRYPDGFAWGCERLGTRTSLGGAAPVAGAMVFAYAAAPELIDQFASAVRDGTDLSKRDPAYTLREYLRTTAYTSVEQREKATAATLRCILAKIKGESITALKHNMLLEGHFRTEAARYFGRANGRPLPRQIRPVDLGQDD